MKNLCMRREYSLNSYYRDFGGLSRKEAHVGATLAVARHVTSHHRTGDGGNPTAFCRAATGRPYGVERRIPKTENLAILS